MKWSLVIALLLMQASAFSLDREAFTFTNYVLDVRLEPDQQRIGVRGTITLRNDSGSPQKYLCLQISSSMGWRSVEIEGNPAEFMSQTYTSDVDHTGALSEAIVTLPREIAPHGVVELKVGYEGIIVQDSTRLERIGTPRDVARQSEWDEIGKTFTAVRGVGHVTWYPVAMEAASLSDEGSVTSTVERWKQRNAESKMLVTFAHASGTELFFSGARAPHARAEGDNGDIANYSTFTVARAGVEIQTFVLATYQEININSVSSIEYFAGHEEVARAFAQTMSKVGPFIHLGREATPLRVMELPYSNGAAFVAEGMLLTPLAVPVSMQSKLTFVYASARAAIRSQRDWIREGLAHYAQVSYLEEQGGRQSALDYLTEHRKALLTAEQSASANTASGQPETSHATRSMLNTTDELYLQTKALNIWWILRDMLGDHLNSALQSYDPSKDKEPSYMQRLLEKEAHTDLEWFFDDWVYRDRGLPDFRVEQAYTRKLLGGSYMVTVTVENLGGAGAEVPVTLRMAGGRVTHRLQVRAKSKASVRIEAASAPQEVVVNDGSVPESDTSNNNYKIVLPEN